MFTIDRSGDERLRDWRIVDETRDAELRSLRGIGGPEYHLFRLTSKGRVVPILTETSRQPKQSGSIPGFVHTIEDFGQSRPFSRDQDTANRITFGGEPPYRFSSPAERSELLLLAAEALLVYGSGYSGLDVSDGFYQVVIDIDGDDRVFRMSDFGYVSPEVIRLWVDGEPEEYTVQ